MQTQALTPRQIVAELDKYIVGQKQAKNRWRLPCAIDIAAAFARAYAG